MPVNLASQKEVMLLGSTEGDKALLDAYRKVINSLVITNSYDFSQDRVYKDEGFSESHMELLDEVAGIPTDYIEEVVYFDNGEIKDFDLALELAPYIFNGTLCHVISKELRVTQHELVIVYKVENK